MKKVLFLVSILLVSGYSFAQKKDKTLVTINDQKVKVSEFKRVFEKNLSSIESEEGKDVAKNLDLFINYKLKVDEAYRLKLDTSRSYKREIETYKNQLTAPYLQDKKFLEKLIKDAYDRTKTEIRASHILVRFPANYTSGDTLAIYKKIMNLRDSIVNHDVDFSEMARKYSDDRSAKTNGGDLGYFGAFKMVFDFEDAAFKTKIGEVSMPFKTRFGYHIVKKVAERPSKGEVQVAHILITDKTETGKKKIDTVYRKLIAGESFKELAKKYSNDVNTKNKGGRLSKFGSGRMVKPFEIAAFSLENKGDYSKPFETRFGWHILQLYKKYPVESFEKTKAGIRTKVKRSGRAKLSDNAVLNKLKKQYKIVEFEDAKSILKRKDIRGIPKDSLQAILISINEKEIKQEAFVLYIRNRRNKSIPFLFNAFIDYQVLEYFKENLVHTEPEYATSLQEYKDGILLFELMNKKIWDKSSKDTLGLQTYFDKNMAKYSEKDLSKIRGKVISDYQNYLEKSWIAELKKKNAVKVNKRELKKLIKYYRKEE
ncbi:peptidylprolyl isomerase [Flavobacteriaceae bacterium S356]|uniref:Peptidylprolyl isomerase n=1 Tax=Asprobacillus argus TaxID=3076534 RepID=A0ABU3LEP7_9FLAO|nr:peptidylprolyl isomerase [Flavobacteriaceae bacterium S356]